ncbi:MAG: hypothetical protein ACTHLR_09215 [Rhizomicrobium sp.]
MRLVVVTMLALSASAAFGADAPPKTTLVRGTIEKFDPKSSITIKTESGSEVTAQVTLASRVATVEKRSFSQIKPKDFIGVTASPGNNGHLHAEEIHIIPLAGLGEGQYPWAHHPSGAAAGSMGSMGSMTNGTVAPASKSPTLMGGSMTNGTVTTGGGAWQLNVTYRGAAMVDGKCEGLAVPGKPGCTGSAVVDVSPETPIVAIVPWRKDMVKTGIYGVAALTTDPSGKTVLSSITIEKNGVKPEF